MKRSCNIRPRCFVIASLVRVVMASEDDADELVTALDATPSANLSAALNMTVESITPPVAVTAMVESPHPPDPPRPPSPPPLAPGIVLVRTVSELQNAIRSLDGLHELSIFLQAGISFALGGVTLTIFSGPRGGVS